MGAQVGFWHSPAKGCSISFLRVHRRYCRATAQLSDGRRTALIYVIEAGQGFAGVGWNVEYCLPAYDPWRVYDAWCHAIEPNPY